MTAAFLQRLSLVNFRSYHAAQINLDRAGPVVLTGQNGAGKTNLIEAISMLTPGRGLRRATLDELAFAEGDGSWAVSAEIEGMLGLATLGTGIEPPAGDDTTNSRKCRIDREPVSSAAAFADHLRVIWLTPSMDPLFTGPAADRRRYLDRLVLAVDAQHSSRVSALERSLRSRNRLLEDQRSDAHWLDAIEHETAEVAVAVSAARYETVNRLSAALDAARDEAPAFAMPRIALEGWMENQWPVSSAREVEDRYRELLRESRGQDAAAGRTLEGPHRADLKVFHVGKGIAAADASTGEQKAMLIRLSLAHAHLIKDMTGYAPVMLLDEVVAHLDPVRRAALYEALTSIGAQVWMTGADPAAFADIADRAQWFDVKPGGITKRA
ncbi:recombinase RecF [Pseudolabrys sp. Root1462]|jgi:DNA replication and repair protein RecF|uniref:DNA replication/repair protein RecF n=1 Tax=Pseudolabrys sp. Root1462 TaxID=1736466 RepID=UPI000702ABF4|nr:DNA replication/repair protein RecF [Pseudolabrys sp. Root1462]KQY97704.1 recombinase RecF [Pseudolabrys sp. Root1462]